MYIVYVYWGLPSESYAIHICVELGYAQGMNDLLARFLVVTDSEVDSYWMFSKYMEYKQEDFLEHSMMKKVGEFYLSYHLCQEQL